MKTDGEGPVWITPYAALHLKNRIRGLKIVLQILADLENIYGRSEPNEAFPDFHMF